MSDAADPGPLVQRLASALMVPQPWMRITDPERARAYFEARAGYILSHTAEDPLALIEREERAVAAQRESLAPGHEAAHPCPMPAALTQDEIAALARSHSRAALQVLVEALDSPDPGERVAAAVALLNAGYGAPVQPIALDSTHGVTLEVHTVEAPGHRSANGEDAEDGAAWRAWMRQREG
jgi:hypothetical protein